MTEKTMYVVKSKKRKKEHMTVIINSESKENMERTVREIKKAIHKRNRLIAGGISYEIYSHITKI